MCDAEKRTLTRLFTDVQSLVVLMEHLARQNLAASPCSGFLAKVLAVE